MTATASKFEGYVALAFPNHGMSDEEFFEFCQLNRDLKIERKSSGEIIIMSPTGSKTGILNARFIGVLFNWNQLEKMESYLTLQQGLSFPMVLPMGQMQHGYLWKNGTPLIR